MPITVLADMILPNSIISAAVRGKIKRTNSRVQHGETGYVSINAVSSQGLREYELGTVPLPIHDWQTLQSFHEITLGGTYGFLLEDPSDSVASFSSIALVPAAGAAPAYYQLQRRYIEPKSLRYSDRPITRPHAGSFKLFNANGSPFAGSYTLDPLTGRITASVDPSTLQWSGRFYVPVQFQSDTLDWELVIAGGYDQRFLLGPSVMLDEVRE
jgi:uncharacterized protein (TIGR02217 family)